MVEHLLLQVLKKEKMVGSTLPQPSGFPIPKVGPLPVYLATGAAAVRFGNFLRRRIDIELEFLSRSSCKVTNSPPTGHPWNLPNLYRNFCSEKSCQTNVVQSSLLF